MTTIKAESILEYINKQLQTVPQDKTDYQVGYCDALRDIYCEILKEKTEELTLSAKQNREIFGLKTRISNLERWKECQWNKV